MKLELTGHNYQYAAEQIMTVLFPGEKPVYGPVGPEDEDWARIRLSVGGTYAVAVTVLHRAGKETRGESRVRACRLEEDALARDRLGQRIVKLSFFKAAAALTGQRPPWGALTGIRPARLVTQMLQRGMTEGQAVAEMTG